MRNKLSCRLTWLRAATELENFLPGLLFAKLGCLGAALLLAAPPAGAGVPGWLQALARIELPEYPPETEAVMLLDEQTTTVTDEGEIRTTYRRAYKILRPGGRDYAHVVVHFDNETKLTFLKAWGIPPDGKEFEVKEKDAAELAFSPGVLYEDTRYKVLQIPGAEPGALIGYEYEQKRRPHVLQDMWLFQDPLPVRKARFVLTLPAGWEFETFWFNHSPADPVASGGNTWTWELENIPALKREPLMPAWRAVAGWLAVNYFPASAKLSGKSHATWADVGRWYSRLASARRQSTPEIKQKVAELTAGESSILGKIRALSAFAQRDVRYVAIEIGIGGYQPHTAADILSNRYGDCKDKATLLSTMLREIGVESFYVLIHTDRGVVMPDFASPMSFNHAILAIQLPKEAETEGLFSVREHPKLGRLLFFDPTSELTPFGQLPSYLQASRGLLVTDDAGELIELPLLPPDVNRLRRTARLELAPDGTLTGEVEEIRTGWEAVLRRQQLVSATANERSKVLENFLASFLPGFTLTNARVQNLESFDDELIVRYRFTARNYAKRAGNLLLVRPRVMGQKATDILEVREGRTYPVDFGSTGLYEDVFEIRVPEGYHIDELPPPVETELDFALYRSETKLEGNVLRYRRTYEVKDVLVPAERLEELKKFYRRVASDERSSAVFKRGL